MMPCKFCGMTDPKSPGIKQVGKTENDGTFFLRGYRCQECGAAMLLSGPINSPNAIKEEWSPPPLGRHLRLVPAESLDERAAVKRSRRRRPAFLN